LVLPIALALLAQLESRTGARPRFAAAMILAVAWGANIGGIGTKVGTTSNMQLAGFLAESGKDVSFAQFSLVGFGFLLLFAPLAIAHLWRVARSDAPPAALLSASLADALPPERRWSGGERAVASVFAATATLWIAAQPITELLADLAPGLAARTRHVEAGAALLAAFVLAVWRPGGRALLSRSTVFAMPWAALLLIGGSFALADGMEASGLSGAIAPIFDGLGTLPPLAQTAVVACVAVLTSAFASNTATVAILLPLIAAAAPAGREITLLFAATIASSCDFALPAGTPPNAIAFASGRVPFLTMVRAGIGLDLLAALAAAVWCEFTVRFVLG
jgi:sodium-dependent dicarboxylate transporter 2/3/5